MGQREIDSGFVPATGWRMPVQYSYPEAMAVTYTSTRVGAFTMAIPVAVVLAWYEVRRSIALTVSPGTGLPSTASVRYPEMRETIGQRVPFAHAVDPGKLMTYVDQGAYPGGRADTT